MLDLGLRGGAAAAPGTGPRAGPFRLLVRLFLRRFLENDLLSGSGDNRAIVATVAAVLAAPGAFTLIFLTLAYAGPFLTPSERLLMALDHKYQFIAASMLLAALAAALEWDAMSLDERDLAILGPLPLTPGRLIGAKVAALGLFLLALTTACNLIPTLGVPVVWLSLVPIGPLQGAWLTLVHGLVSVAAAATGFLSVLAVRSLVALASPTRLVRLLSTTAQFGLVLCLATLFLLSPILPADVLDEIEHPTRATSMNPAMWLLGGYERLTARGLYANPRLVGPATWKFWEEQQLRRKQNLGPEVWAHPLPLYRHEAEARARYHATMPTLDGLATRGFVALPLLAAGSGALYLFAHLRRGRRRQEAFAPAGRPSGALGRLWWVLAGWVAPRPIVHATFAFTLHALSRHGPQRLHFAGALALGGALVILLYTQGGGAETIPASPTSSLLALEYVLAFFILAGVRRAFGVPAALEANWVFRFALDGANPRPAVAGVRRALAAAIVLPLFSALAVAHAVAWGPFAALTHLVVGALLSFVLVEVLLAGFDRIPFTYARGPGDVGIRWPFTLAALVAFAYAAGSLEAIALSNTTALAAVATSAIAAAAGVRLTARRWRGAEHHLSFDVQPETAVRLDI